MVLSTVWRSRVELTAWPTSPNALQFADGLRQFARPRLKFLEQPHVLNRDYRLVGEGFKQFDLLIREMAGLLVRRIRIAPMAKPSCSNGVARTSERQPLLVPRDLGNRDQYLPLKVMHMNRLLVDHRSPAGVTRSMMSPSLRTGPSGSVQMSGGRRKLPSTRKLRHHRLHKTGRHSRRRHPSTG